MIRLKSLILRNRRPLQRRGNDFFLLSIPRKTPPLIKTTGMEPAFYMKWSREESNLDQELRSLLFYPLNYGTEREGK